MPMLMTLLAILMTALPGREPPAEPAAEPEQADETPVRFENAGELLEALEQADRGVRSFSARVRYHRVFALAGDLQTRDGWFWFRTDPPAEASPAEPAPPAPRKRSVAVRFDTFASGGRLDKQERVWVFDGEWLVEKDPAERQFIKRRMVRPGEVFDPLRVGEGPFFVPVGQKRSDMEMYFHTALRPSGHGLSAEENPTHGALLEALASKLEGYTQLELRPRAGFPQVEDFELIRIWYDPQTLLPRASMSVDPLGDIDIFELFEIDINEERRSIPPDAFDVQIPDAGQGWHIEVIDGAAP